jgi:hypothetical protein
VRGAVIAVAGGLVPRDRLQMRGDIANACGRRLAMRLRSPIVCLSGAQMPMRGGQVRLPSPHACLFRVARR